jgi:2-dehydro-3-deoxygalactonokinase
MIPGMPPDSVPGRPALVALDWGTSTLRGYLLDAAGAAIDTRHAALGILRVADGDFEAALERFCGDWFAASPSIPLLASGMIGSRQGWREAAYVPCPASVDELGRRLLRFETGRGRQVAIVPGVVREGDVPDVMRGEETQIAGALGADGAGRFVLPGTHSKWASVADGAITAFRTFMTGELFAVLVQHSILGRLMEGDAADIGAFARGVAFGLAEGGLGGKLFSARTLGLFGRVPGAGLHDYLSGLLIGAEIADARGGDDASGMADGRAVTLIGDPALAARYRDALAIAGVAAEIADEQVTPRGLLRIARAAGLVG